MKLSEWMDDGFGIVLFNSPGGSTVKWDAGRGLLCVKGKGKGGPYSRRSVGVVLISLS